MDLYYFAFLCNVCSNGFYQFHCLGTEIECDPFGHGTLVRRCTLTKKGESAESDLSVRSQGWRLNVIQLVMGPSSEDGAVQSTSRFFSQQLFIESHVS